MNERSKSQGKSKPSRNEMEVEQLLQAAQDELVLNLSINSHMSRVSPNYIDSDLDRRFQALKKSGSSVVPQESSNNKELKAVMGDDLSARFAALKGSSSSSSSSSSTPGVGVVPNNILSGDGDGDGDGDEDEEDEVEKLIRWAKDAARLDPSPPSDDDDHDDEEEEEEEEEDDDDEEEEDYKDEHQKPKGHHHRK
ncbi:46 kDa FK506-binding nuclear protein [Fagus crenata]